MTTPSNAGEGEDETEYDLALEARVADARSTYRFRTADGVHSKRAFRDSELLLLEALWDVDHDLGDLCCPEANYGTVGVVLAAIADSVEMTESSARAAALCRRNARANDVAASVSLVAELSTLSRSFDTIAYAPKPYTPLSIGSQRLVGALSRLRPGGRLYLAASNRCGLSRYESRLAELTANVERVAQRDGVSLLEATCPETVDRPTYVTPRTLTPTVDGTSLSLVTVPGLFAASGLDDGTRLLLETCEIDDGERVLDLCCGYGPIGVYAAKTADCEVWLADDDRVATRCAERSLRESGVDGTVVTADCLAGVFDRSFDRVLCNPPTHAGSDVLSDLLAGIARVLEPNGRLTLVHHRELDLGQYLTHVGRPTTSRVGEAHVVIDVMSDR
ncbi:methyltransferase [Halobacteria archaeon AArc-m2/3/4]|uniref:Methyltransferase n=1 Tax=Natronoglomus mannanivorans TaxID=2979990 RepID=A0AAP3E0A7_9EURY|nr:methyltransferase [Halobacteria archaeon AArc-xg1-1]MCU4973062.1 methyltransferase [Halobacteria archaeon AArc-m2/3/4]